MGIVGGYCRNTKPHVRDRIVFRESDRFAYEPSGDSSQSLQINL